jgi:hypothetical protein
MILHTDKLNDASSELANSLKILDILIPSYDLFIVATTGEHLQKVAEFEKRQKVKVTRPDWSKLVRENKGLIFFVTSGSFRRKTCSFISEGLSKLEEYFQERSKNLFVASLTKNEKFDVFFIGEKTIQEEKNAIETV